jgi:hypothetical protein
MAARKRKNTERSLTEYHKNLDSEQRAIDYRLGTQYARAAGRGVFNALKRKIMRLFAKSSTPSFTNPNKKVKKAANKAQKLSRRYNRNN